MKSEQAEGKSFGDIMDTLLKKALRHHIILIAYMILALVYIFHSETLIAAINDTDWFIKVSAMLFFIAGFLAIQYLIFQQMKQDTTITEIIDKGESGEIENIKRSGK